MSVIIEATYQNGAFRSAQPVSLPDGAKVRLLVTPVDEKDAFAGQKTAAEPFEHGPVFIWSRAMYRARKAAQEFSKETHADY